MRLACLVGILCAPALAPAAALSPQDFAYGMPIITREDASAYSVLVPAEVYRGSVDEGLGDIRVFNASGEIVPYSLKRHDAAPLQRSPPKSLPLFPLRGGSRVVIDGIRVSVDSPQSSVSLQTRKDELGAAAVNQYILDGGVLEVPVSAIELDWPQSAAEFSGRMRVDASDDLNAWRTVVDSAPIANLHANGRQLIERRIELPATKSKYWRLSWVGAPPSFELNAVWAQPTENPVELERSDLVLIGALAAGRADDYRFDVGAHLPVERVNLLLPELNTVLEVDLQSRARAEAPWREVAHHGFYRLKTPEGEQSNGPVAIDTDRDRYWRALLAVNARPNGALKLKVSWTPNELVFLARGSGPFMLAYGNANAASAEADLGALPSSIPIVRAELGAPIVLGGPSRLIAAAPVFPSKRKLLWLILVAAVCLLAWMAYRLVREREIEAEQPP